MPVKQEATSATPRAGETPTLPGRQTPLLLRKCQTSPANPARSHRREEARPACFRLVTTAATQLDYSLIVFMQGAFDS